MDRGKILILMAYKFLTRWEDIPWRVVGGKGWGRGSRDVHAPVVGKVYCCCFFRGCNCPQLSLEVVF
jgi:hypothetical protein